MNKLRSTQKKLDPDGRGYLLLDNGAVRERLRGLMDRFATWDEVRLAETKILALVVDAFDAGKDLGEDSLAEDLAEAEAAEIRLDDEVLRLDDLLGSAIAALHRHDKKLAGQLQRERNGG